MALSNRPTQQEDLQIFRFDFKGKFISIDEWILSVYASQTWKGLVMLRLGVQGRAKHVERGQEGDERDAWREMG